MNADEEQQREGAAEADTARTAYAVGGSQPWNNQSSNTG